MNSLTITSDMMKLKLFCMNTKNSFHSRKNIVDRLSSIPHKDKNIHISECLLSLISDDKIPIDQRYSLFCNNNSFDNDVQYKCHLFYFNNFNNPNYPIRYKLMSAQYLLQSTKKNEVDLREVYNYLKYLLKNSTDIQIKGECSDILFRNGYNKKEIERLETSLVNEAYNNSRKFVEPKIENLSEDRRRVLIKRRTVYDDGQNVHNTSVNEGVKANIRKLFEEFKNTIHPTNRINNLNDFSKRLTILSKDKSQIVKKKINGTLDRILIDTSKFECDTTLCDIVIMVWMKVKTSTHIPELEKRVLEEMEEMNGLCATGHLSRIMNILSGFFEDFSVGISFKDQIKNYVYLHYNNILMSEKYTDLSEKIIEEMTESVKDKKSNLLKMISDNDIRVKLKDEFSESKNEFDELYDCAVKSYCGL